jgi:transposase InsO family protein
MPFPSDTNTDLDKHETPTGAPVVLSVPPSVVLFGCSDAAQLAGCSRQAILKAITSGKLPAEPVEIAEGRRKGRTEYRIPSDTLFSLYPHARASYQAQQADHRPDRFSVEVIPPPAQPRMRRDPVTVALRADPDSLQREQEVQLARLDLMHQVRTWILQTLSPYHQAQARLRLPDEIRVKALAWIATTPEGQDLMLRLGRIPSTDTLSRWWHAFTKDPSGESLRPLWTACGRKRRTDIHPDLVEKIEGAYAFAGNFTAASKYLLSMGVEVSPATVGRHIKSLAPAIQKGFREGSRKALADQGPYVHRAASRPYQCWSMDGHKLDVGVIWQEPRPGEVLRPFRPDLYVVRDVGSGAILSIAVGKGLNRYMALQALAEAIVRTGVIPEMIQTDNGSEICNALMEGKEDTTGYFAQLSMNWKEGRALWTRALPYNARSKPIEEDFRVLKDRFSAKYPTFTGGSVSKRPGDPLNAAHKAGHFLTVEELETHLENYRLEHAQTLRNLKQALIHPLEALREEKARLIKTLGPAHPRFFQEDQVWKVLPAVPARLDRTSVVCTVEGQKLRFLYQDLVEQQQDGLEVRISPWDVSSAWLCRKGQPLGPLTFLPDASALGAEERNLVSLRLIKNTQRQIRHRILRAEAFKAEAQATLGMLTGRAQQVVRKRHHEDSDDQYHPAPASTPELSDEAFAAAQAQFMAEQAMVPLEDAIDRFMRIHRTFQDGDSVGAEDLAWWNRYTSTPEGQAALDTFSPVAN